VAAGVWQNNQTWQLQREYSGSVKRVVAKQTSNNEISIGVGVAANSISVAAAAGINV